MPKFSVIIPTYNRVDLLQSTLGSVFDQTFSDYEVIVVDDGSTDDTARFLSRLESRVRVVTTDRVGPGGARNAGVIEAAGQYLAFLDSDDLWYPWTLDVYDDAIMRADQPAFVVGKPLVFERQSEFQSVRHEDLQVNHFHDYLDSWQEWRWYGVSSFVCRADVFRATAGFLAENVNCEDADFALKIGTASGFLQIVAPSTFGYRRHDGNITGHLRKSVAGVRDIINAEKCNRYPGGALRASERRQIITRHVRPLVLDCISRKMHAAAFALYWETSVWHVQSLRLRFLLGFWWKLLLSSLGSSNKSPHVRT